MTKPTRSKLQDRPRSEIGATLIEYAVLAALIVVVAMAAIQLVGTKISQQFSSIASSV